MTVKKIKMAFFDTKPYDRRSFDEVNKEYGFDIKYFHHRLNQDTVELAKGCNVTCIFVHDIVDADVVKGLKKNNVGLIALRCAGYNNVDLKAVYKTIPVVRVPVYSPYAVAEHAVALLLSLNRKIHRAYYRVRDGNFSIDGFLGFDLSGKTAGVIGSGRIGRCIIGILKGFGIKILVYDPYPDKEYAKREKIEYVSLATLFKNSDIISLHCPLTPKTHHIIKKSSIDKMKTGVILINTGRGGLVDAKALIAGLKSGKIGYAGLDVYEEESEYFFEDFSSTVISDDTLARLLTFPNVLITSHQGFFTREALYNIAKTTFDNIAEFVKGDNLKNEVKYKNGKS